MITPEEIECAVDFYIYNLEEDEIIEATLTDTIRNAFSAGVHFAEKLLKERM